MSDKKATKGEVAQGGGTNVTPESTAPNVTPESIEQNVKKIIGIIDEALTAKSRSLGRPTGQPTVYIHQVVIHYGSSAGTGREGNGM